MNDDEPVYVYGVVKRARLPRHLAEHGLQLVTCGPLGALVTALEASPLEASRRNLLAHADVVEEAFAWTTILPARFGLVLPDAGAVRDQLLDANRDSLERLLEQHAATEELTVRAFYDEETMLAKLVADGPQLARLRRLYQDAPTLEHGMALGEAVAASLEAQREADSRRVLDALGPLALDVRVGELLAEQAVLNFSLLLERGGTQHVERRLEELRPELPPALRFRLTGPLPPYSFVEIEPAVIV